MVYGAISREKLEHSRNDTKLNYTSKIVEPNQIIVVGQKMIHRQFFWCNTNLLFKCKTYWKSQNRGLWTSRLLFYWVSPALHCNTNLLEMNVGKLFCQFFQFSCSRSAFLKLTAPNGLPHLFLNSQTLQVIDRKIFKQTELVGTVVENTQSKLCLDMEL